MDSKNDGNNLKSKVIITSTHPIPKAEIKCSRKDLQAPEVEVIVTGPESMDKPRDMSMSVNWNDLNKVDPKMTLLLTIDESVNSFEGMQFDCGGTLAFEPHIVDTPSSDDSYDSGDLDDYKYIIGSCSDEERIKDDPCAKEYVVGSIVSKYDIKLKIKLALSEFHHETKEARIHRSIIAKLLCEKEYDYVFSLLNNTNLVSIMIDKNFKSAETPATEPFEYKVLELDGIGTCSLFHILIIHGDTRLLDVYMINSLWKREYSSIEEMFKSLNHKGQTCFEALKKIKQGALIVDYFYRNPDTREVIKQYNLDIPHNLCVCKQVDKNCLDWIYENLSLNYKLAFISMFCRNDCDNCMTPDVLKLMNEHILEHAHENFYKQLHTQASSFDFYNFKNEETYASIISEEQLSLDQRECVEKMFCKSIEYLDWNMILLLMKCYPNIYPKSQTYIPQCTTIALFDRIVRMDEMFIILMRKPEYRPEIDSLFEKAIFGLNFALRTMIYHRILNTKTDCDQTKASETTETNGDVLFEKGSNFLFYALTMALPSIVLSGYKPNQNLRMKNIMDSLMEKIFFPTIEKVLLEDGIDLRSSYRFQYFISSIKSILPEHLKMKNLIKTPPQIIKYIRFCLHMWKIADPENKKPLSKSVLCENQKQCKISNKAWEAIQPNNNNLWLTKDYIRKFSYEMGEYLPTPVLNN